MPNISLKKAFFDLWKTAFGNKINYFGAIESWQNHLSEMEDAYEANYGH